MLEIESKIAEALEYTDDPSEIIVYWSSIYP